MKAEYAIGIDLGGTRIKGVLARADGSVLARGSLPTRMDSAQPGPAEQVRHWIETIRHLVHSMEKEAGLRVARLALAAPGLAAADGGSIAHMPGRLQGLEGLDWTAALSMGHPVPALNDGHAALLGEVWAGAGRGYHSLCMLTLGTGVGGAVMVEGKLLRGTRGRGGHLGHLCLDPLGAPDITAIPGSLENCISDSTVTGRSHGRFSNTADLIEAHLRGDSHATLVWLRSVHELACSVASLINILDPQAVIVGGGIARAGTSLFKPLRQFLELTEWKVPGHRVDILPAAMDEYAGALGAAASFFVPDFLRPIQKESSVCPF